MAAKILAFAGSVRNESFNRRLLPAAIEGARSAGAEVTHIELKDFPLPLFDQDQEAREGLPPNARKLKDLFKAHGGLLLACPEYNGSITPLLKNTLDWVSRQDGAESGTVPYKRKAAGLISASDGRWGGIRGLTQVRHTLTILGCIVLPEQYCLSAASKAYDDAGRIIDDKVRKGAGAIGGRLAEFLKQGSA
ncbi:MAG: NADPH-dependent FMN reductase [Nevskiaceae bacterium]